MSNSRLDIKDGDDVIWTLSYFDIIAWGSSRQTFKLVLKMSQNPKVNLYSCVYRSISYVLGDAAKSYCYQARLKGANLRGQIYITSRQISGTDHTVKQAVNGGAWCAAW